MTKNIKHILLRQFVHVTSVPDRTHSFLILDIFHDKKKIAFHRNQVNKSLQRGGKQKLCTAPPAVSSHQEENSDAFHGGAGLCRGHKDRLARLFDPVPNVWETDHSSLIVLSRFLRWLTTL